MRRHPVNPLPRAPYFADPDSEGWSGRRSGGGKKKRKKAAAGAAGFVDIYGQGVRCCCRWTLRTRWLRLLLAHTLACLAPQHARLSTAVRARVRRADRPSPPLRPAGGGRPGGVPRGGAGPAGGRAEPGAVGAGRRRQPALVLRQGARAASIRRCCLFGRSTACQARSASCFHNVCAARTIWIAAQNKPLVSRVVLLVAHGLDSELWESDAARAALPTWRAHLGEPVVLQARNATLAPGECSGFSCVGALFDRTRAGLLQRLTLQLRLCLEATARCLACPPPAPLPGRLYRAQPADSASDQEAAARGG